MKRSVTVRAGVAVALVLALLAGSFSPVGAANTSIQAGDGLVVGSQHTTASDLSDGSTLVEMHVSGSGEAASVVPNSLLDLSDGFDDGDTSGWTVDSGGTFSAVTSPVQEGSHAAEYAPNTDQWGNLVSVSQVTTTGNVTIEGYLQDQSGETQENDAPWLSLAAGPDNQYGIYVSPAEDTVEIIEINGGGKTTLDSTSVSLSHDTYYYAELTRNQRTGKMTTTVKAPDGSTIATLSATDKSVSPTKAGIGAFRNTPTYDDIEVTESNVRGAYYSYHSVSNAAQAAINVTSFSNVTDVSLSVKYDTGSQWLDGNTTHISTASNHTLSLPDVSYETWRIVVEYTTDGTNPQLSIADDSILFTPHAPNATEVSPADGTKLTSPGANLTVNVSDADFGTTQGDSISATFFANGEQVGTDSRSSNGTLRTTLDVSGKTEWYAVLEDSYGEQYRTENRTIAVPSTVEIRSVHDQQKLLNGSNVTITGRFFSGELVFERTTSNGLINLTDLPPERQYVLVLQADGYYRRTVIVESLYKQSSVFLLNSSKPSHYTEFAINDLTGEFTGPGTQTRLHIERALNTSGDLQWMTIGGDFLGAEGRFEIELEQNARYRIRLASGSQTRVLGAYTATRAGTVTLTVGAVQWEVDEPTTVQHRASFHNLTDGAEEPNGMVHWQYVNPNETTSELRVVIREDDNESNTIMNSTFSGGYGTLSLNQTISGSQMNADWQVHWTAYDSSGQVIGSGTDVVTGQRIKKPNPIGPKWTPVILTCLFLFVGTMFGGRLSSVGSLVIVGVAGVMWYLGWYTASGGVVVFAGVVAVAMAIGGGARR